MGMSQDALQQGNRDDGDAVDVIVGQWQRERPDLDPSAKEITGRIIRLGSLFERTYSDAFTAFGLNEGDYSILAPLRRAGAPFELTPTELAKHRMITSGGMTAALDRLERKGLVVRSPNPADRRGSLIRLTSTGREIIDTAMTSHTEIEHHLVSPLDQAEQVQLQALLRKLLQASEPYGDGRPSPGRPNAYPSVQEHKADQTNNSTQNKPRRRSGQGQ
jgi:DNA-binding MarR family transcriptional regulator